MKNSSLNRQPPRSKRTISLNRRPSRNTFNVAPRKYINGRMATRKNYINNTFVKNAYKNAEHRRRRSALSRRLGTVRSLLSRTRASRRSNA